MADRLLIAKTNGGLAFTENGTNYEGELKETNLAAASAIDTDDTLPIFEDGNIKKVTTADLQGFTSRWKDVPAAAFGSSGYNHVNDVHTAFYLQANVQEYAYAEGYSFDPAYLVVPIPYEEGSIITAFRIKYKVSRNLSTDSMQAFLKSRDAATAATVSLSTLDSGASGTSTAPAIISTTCGSPRTMTSAYEYMLVVQYIGDTGEFGWLYSVGWQTSKRVYT